jgi:hypothetical protein
MAQAMESLSSVYYSKILAVTMFGDPNVRGGLLRTQYSASLRQKLLENCDARDPVCLPSLTSIEQLNADDERCRPVARPAIARSTT